MHIIPNPLKTEQLDGIFEFDSTLKIFYNRDSQRAVQKLNDFLLEHYKFRIKTVEHEEKNLLISENFINVADKAINGNNEAYNLEIKNGIVIRANHNTGIFYGVITLCQMLEDSLNLQCCLIEDAPAMQMRGIHWDLKGLMTTFDYLKEQIKRYAFFKINTILVEYEDKFSYDRHPVLNSSNALSKKQVKELIKFAKENYIQIIPLVQSLGHAEYILRHKEYAYVAETPNGKISQMCPSNPRTFELFESFIDELIELHDSEYIHIGGDETRQLGECNECASFVKQFSDIDLYFRYIKKCCEAIVSRGRKPIIWDDMICSRFRLDLLEQLPPKTILCCWEYERQEAKHPYFKLGHDRIFSRTYKDLKNCAASGCETLSDYYEVFPELYGRYYKIYEELSLEKRRKISEFVKIPESPELFDSLPALNLARKASFKSICASGAHISIHGQVMPDFSIAPKNIRTLSKRVAGDTSNIAGMISTSWSRSGGSAPVNAPQETRFYVYVLSAEHAWSGGRISDAVFDRNFSRRVFGCIDDSIEEILWLLKHHIVGGGCLVEKFEACAGKIKRSALSFESLQIAGEIEEMRAKINNERFDKWFGLDMLTAKSGKEYIAARKKLEAFRKQVLDLQNHCRNHLLKYMPEGETKEYTDTIFLRVSLTVNAMLEHVNKYKDFLFFS